jgi:putative iron-dependent peroxidase
MSVGQIGIFALGDAAHGFFEFTLRSGAEGRDLIRRIASLPAPHTTVGGANSVVGFRPELWRGCAPIPDEVRGFNEDVRGPDGFSMPATQTDAFVWYSSASYDLVFDLGLSTLETLASVAVLTRENRGWSYQHSRDLTGFEDGTKNPTLYEAPAVALIERGAPGEGGSVLLFQQWRHETAAWQALGDARQERVIGRTKSDSVEFSEDTMPPDSHVERTTLDVDGVELPIFRRNVPYGTVSDHGTLFIGFAAQQRRLHDMLRQMAGADGGPRDELTRFTTPLTGAYYFCPSVDALARFATPDSP